MKKNIIIDPENPNGGIRDVRNIEVYDYEDLANTKIYPTTLE